MTDPIQPVLAPNLQNQEGLYHAFHTRKGGCSLNPVSFEPTDLDCGLFITQDRDSAELNRRAVRRHANAAALVSLKQVHSTRVVSVTGMPDRRGNGPGGEPEQTEPEEADALVTNVENLAIGVLSADCGPVLFCDPAARVIGAAHAGWQGAANGVLDNTVAAMEKLGADRSKIHAALGPCIQQASYEVGPEFYRKFILLDPENSVFFGPSKKKQNRQTHYMFDLPGFITAALERLNLAGTHSTGHDTCAGADLFFSHRRGTLLKKPETMRHISTVCMKG